MVKEEKNKMDDIEFTAFQSEMRKALEEHYNDYGDSWKEMSPGKLYTRVKHKLSEFDLTFKKSKLLSAANLCMLLYIRMKDNPPMSQNPEVML